MSDEALRMLRITLLALLPKDGSPVKVAELARQAQATADQVTNALFADYLDREIAFDIRTDTFRAIKQGEAL